MFEFFLQVEELKYSNRNKLLLIQGLFNSKDFCVIRYVIIIS